VRKFPDYLLLYAKGVAMGMADVIPGVSGGTIAFISGIYDELLHAIRSADLTALRMFLRMDIAGAWKRVNGWFLMAVLAGIITSLLSLSKLMTWLLANHPVQVWSFFFGLILVSAPMIFRDVKSWSGGGVAALMAGIAVAYAITVLSPAETPINLPFIFFCGALAICAMILPGISGAFILLLIGKYQYMINALITFDFPVILTFVAGCVIGLAAFSHVLTWLLDRHRDVSLALLAGFMIGSLNKVWPWKEVTEYRIDHSGNKVAAFDRSIWPWDYLEKSGQEPQVLYAVGFAIFGVVLILGIEKIAALMKAGK